MATALRPIGHEDRLSLTEHLDELRTRLIVCGLAFAVAFGVALWQNHVLLRVVNRPLEQVTTHGGRGPLSQQASSQLALRRALESGGRAFQQLARSGSARTPADRQALREAARSYGAAVRALPARAPGRHPVTLGVGEPLGTTLTISAYFALLLALPVILYQAYAFVLPAFSRGERRVALPLMLLVPVLFVGGVLFGYFVVLPPAIRFLQTFNSGSFDVLVQARPYYSFVALTLIAMGALFQIPVAVLALTRAGIVTPASLRRTRRYAIVVIAVVAMLLPGTDPVTTLLEMVPLLALYELSILLASWLDRHRARRAAEPGGDDVDDLSSDAV
ncbi:MAG: twin-arginine translocase subunit TatC [Solirubrobacteraceae bacterium]